MPIEYHEKFRGGFTGNVIYRRDLEGLLPHFENLIHEKDPKRVSFLEKNFRRRCIHMGFLVVTLTTEHLCKALEGSFISRRHVEDLSSKKDI